MECEHKNTALREKIFVNNTKHIERYCEDCGKHIKYEPQGGEYIFYVGRYKGKTLRHALQEDYDYVYWCLENWNGKQQRALQAGMDNLANDLK
jgi:hypothetical protein